MKKLCSVSIQGTYLKISFIYSKKDSLFHNVRYSQKIGDYIDKLSIKIDNKLVFDKKTASIPYHVELNGNFVKNENLNQTKSMNLPWDL